MTLGPVEWIEIGFPGSKLSPSIVQPLKKLVDSGTIRIMDLVGTMARTAVVAGTASAVVGGAASRREARVHQQQAQVDQRVQAALAEQQATAQAAPAATTPAGAVTDESISQLQQLGDLHKQGILTDEEFAAQKARILGA